MSNFNPGNYYLNIDRYGSEIANGGGAPDYNPTPINYVPAASGNTANLNSFVIDPNGDIWFIDEQGDAFKVNTTQTVTTITNTITGKRIATYTNESGVAVDINETVTTLTKNGYIFTYTSEDGTVTVIDATPVDVNLSVISYIPTATGNTQNLNSVVADPNGDVWIIDYQGDAQKLNVGVITTTLTNTVTGHRIGTYTNELGTAVDINETITTLTQSGDILTYTNENGVVTTIDLEVYRDDRYKTTSTTCNDISVPGTKTFIVESGLAYTPLQEVIVYADANNYLIGEVVTYNAVTGALVMDVKFRRGSGTFCSWTANLNAVKLSPISVYFQADDPITSGTTGIEGDEVFVTSDGTCNGTVTEYWVYDDLCGWTQIPLGKAELVQFGTTAPTSTTGYTAGDEFFVTSTGTSAGTITAQYIFNGTSWTLRPVAQLTTTSIVPKVYQSGSFVNAQANTAANVADLLQLSDGSRIHTGEVTWTGHGLTVGAWYYLDQTAPGGYSTTKPTSGLVQQLFFVEDANTIHVDIEEAWVVTGTSADNFAKTVYFNFTDPNSASATIFDLNNPPTTNDNTLKADVNNVYIGSNGSMWTYNSSTGTYTSYTPAATTPIVVNAYGAATSNIPANVWTNITGYPTTLTNTAGTGWNATTGVFTAPRAGYYHAVGGVETFSSSNVAGQITVVQILKNGSIGVAATRDIIQATYAGVQMTSPATGNVYLNAGDTLQLRVLSTQGTRSVSNSSATFFNVNEIK